MEVGWEGEPLEVVAYAGYRGDERPERFRSLQGWREVREVLDRWYGPADTYFKIRADDGHLYILRRSADGRWFLAGFRREVVQ